MQVTVRKVENKADFKAFFEYPWLHYENDPHWVPELPFMRRETLDKKKHGAWDYMDGDYFIAWRGEQIAGTIAAVVNQRHNEVHEENIGFFGFFECINDQSVADALLKTAEDYLREKGVDAMRGPANFTSNEPYGVLIEGFNLDPIIMMPYNPPYYVTLLESYGLEKAMDLYSWRADFGNAAKNLYQEDGSPTKLAKLVRRNNERRKLSVRTLDKKNKRRDFEIIRDLYHSAWEHNWGFVPMTERELDELIENLSFLVMPEYVFFGMVDGKIAGFMLLIPNFNEVFKAVNAHPRLPTPWWLLKTLWHWKIRPKITSLRVILMGVKPEFRKLGVDAALNLALAEQMVKEEWIEWAEGSWVLETNANTNSLLERFAGDLHRKHRIYQKDFA